MVMLFFGTAGSAHKIKDQQEAVICQTRAPCSAGSLAVM